MAENTANKEQETVAAQQSGDAPADADVESPTVNPQDTTGAELVEANNRALRAQAELENFRKRARREMEEQQRYAIAPLLRELLPVVDDMERAIAAAEKSPEAAGLLEGVKMVEARLRNVLEQHGCRKIAAHGAPFDPAQHEAILQQPSSEHEPGTVLQVTQQGYQLHDRVIRPSQVIVSQAAEGGEEST